MCNANATSLRWNVTVPLLQDNNMIRAVLVSYTQIRMTTPMNISSGISFPVSRLSINGSLPLMSTLSVTNITMTFNGMEVECFTRINNTDLTRVTTIDVIRSGTDGKHKGSCIFFLSAKWCILDSSLVPRLPDLFSVQH